MGGKFLIELFKGRHDISSSKDGDPAGADLGNSKPRLPTNRPIRCS
jgi:hypothetical protein